MNINDLFVINEKQHKCCVYCSIEKITNKYYMCPINLPYFRTKQSYYFAFKIYRKCRNFYLKEKDIYERNNNHISQMILAIRTTHIVPFYSGPTNNGVKAPLEIVNLNIKILKDTLLQYRLKYFKIKESYKKETFTYYKAIKNCKINEEIILYNVNFVLKKHLPVEICIEIASFVYINPTT